MYRPPHFSEDNPEALHAFIREVSGAHLVTNTDTGLFCTQLPLLLDLDVGPSGSLVGHVARANPHWSSVGGDGEALAIFGGPQAYVSPSFYPSKVEHGKVVPTWNYSAVHVHGRLVVHDDPDWTLDLVTRLTDHFEQQRAQPWAVTDAPETFIQAQLRGIVGIEVEIERIEGKKKLSQNRAEADRAGVITGLANGSPEERAVAEGVQAEVS